MRLRRILLGIVLGMCLRSETVIAGETYYTVFIDGVKVGYSTHARDVTDGQVQTSELIDITIQRGGAPAVVRIRQSSVETLDGRPVRFEVSQKIGDTEMSMTGVLTAKNRCEVKIANAGRTHTSTVPWHKDTVMAEGLRLRMRSKGLKEETTFVVRVFEPASLISRESTLCIGPRKRIELAGRTVELTEITRTWKTLNETIVHTSYVDDELDSLKVVIPMMGKTCEFVACSRQVALADNEPLDVFHGVIVSSSESLATLLSSQSVTYELAPVGAGRLVLPSGGGQSVREGPEGRVLVTVQPVSMPVGKGFPYEGDDPVALDALGDSRFLQSNRPEIVDLAHQVVGDTRDAAEAVRRIERFAYTYIGGRGSSVGYAPALDILISRRGDCSEHAILTAAMCRAIGIPAQVVSGVACQSRGKGETLFVPHAWTRVYIGDIWVDIDATAMSGRGPGRIALACGDGSPENLLSCLGRFRIVRVVTSP